MKSLNNEYYLNYKDRLVIAMGIFFCPVLFTNEEYLKALDIIISYKGETGICPENN